MPTDEDTRTSADFRVTLSCRDTLVFRVEKEPRVHAVVELERDGEVLHGADFTTQHMRDMVLAATLLVDELTTAEAVQPPPPPQPDRPVAVVGMRMGSQEDLDRAIEGARP